MLTAFVANTVTKPGSSPVIGSPGDYGLSYEDVTFKANDGVTLSGWLIKGGSEKVIVFSHFGAQSSRSGYTPKGKGLIKAYKKEIKYLQMAEHLVNAGYSVLMYDFRNHGLSETGTCEWITGGVEEHKDVIAAVKFISQHQDYKNANIGLLSYCMGCNATTYGFGPEEGLQTYPQVKAFLAMQPLGNAMFMKAFGFPDKLVEKANAFNLKRGGKDIYQTCIDNVQNISVPTLLVQLKEDPWTDMDFVNDYYERLPVEKDLFWIEGPKERLAAYDYFNHSPEKMLAFFGKYL